MKKYLLLILTMLSVSIGTWADIIVSEPDGSGNVTVTSTSTDTHIPQQQPGWQTLQYNYTFTGDFSNWNLDWNADIYNQGDYSNIRLDFSNATIATNKITELLAWGNTKGLNKTSRIVLPNNTPIPSDCSGFNYGGNLKYILSTATNGNVSLYVTSNLTNADVLTEFDLTSTVISNIKNNNNTVTFTGDASAIAVVRDYLESQSVPSSQLIIPYDGNATAVGGSVKTNVDAIVNAAGATVSEVTTLTITSGTLSNSGENNDIDYITSSLSGLTTLDISAATASSADDVWKLLNKSSLTSITLGTSNLTTLKGVTGKTFTTALLAKIADKSYSASSFASELTTNNYILDGTTLIVTGELTADRLAYIKSNFADITSLDVSKCTNNSGNVSFTDNDIPTGVTTVSLPGNEYITYSGNATVLEKGAIVLNIETAGTLQTIAESLQSTILNAEHVVITGTLNGTDLAWLHNLADNGSYSSTSNAVTKTIDLHTVTLAEGTTLSSLPTSAAYGQAAILLPNVAGVENIKITGTNVFWIDGTTLKGNVGTTSQLGHAATLADSDSNINILKLFDAGASSPLSNGLTDFDVDIIDLSEYSGEIGDLSAVTSVKTIIQPQASAATKMEITGTLTNDVLTTLNSLISSSITSLDFGGVTSVASDIDWTILTGHNNIEYIQLPGSESAKVKNFSITRLPALKAVGAYNSNVGYAHVYAAAANGALPTLSTTFAKSDGNNNIGLFATSGITKLVVSGSVAANDLVLNGINVMTATVLDLSGALVAGTGSLALSTAADIIAPSHSTLADMEEYVKTNVNNVYAHGTNQFYICVGNNAALLTNASNYLLEGETTVAVKATATYTLPQTGVTALNSLNVATLDLKEVVFANDDISISNTHITKLIASDIEFVNYGANRGKIVNITGCTNLVEADFSGANMQRLDANGMSALKVINASEIGMPALPEGTTAENYDTNVTATTNGIINVTGTYTNEGFVVDGDEEFNVLRVYPQAAQAKVEKVTGAEVELTVDLANMTGETDTFEKLLNAALDTYNADKADDQKGTLKTITILHINTTNSTKLTTAELSYLVNLKKLGVLDIKNADITELTVAQIANSLKDANSNMRDIALIIPTPESKEFATGQTEVGAYQAAGVKCLAYNPWAKQTNGSYAKNTNKFHIYGTNAVVAKLEPMTRAANFSIVFLPTYTTAGAFSDYPSVESGFIENTLSKFTCNSINMMWLNHSPLGYDFSTLNPATHYIVIPHNSFNADAQHTNDIVGQDKYSGSDYIYGTHNSTDGIWAVMVYAGTASPYSSGISFDGEFLLTQGDNGTGETTSVIYVRETGKLTNAENIFSDLQKNAYRTIMLGQAVGTDLAAISKIHSKKIDLSKVHLTNVDMTSCANSEVEYLALPTEGDPAQFIPANFKDDDHCPNLKGLGLYHSNSTDATDVLNKFYFASWAAGSARKIIEMIPESAPVCSYKMWGPLNNLDIANGNITNGAFYQRASTLIQSADLSMAWFPNPDHMNFSAASAYGSSGATGFQSCELPRTNMTIIPANAFDNMKALTYVAIPDIYTTIKTEAFYGSTVEQIDVYDITTNGQTDLDGVVYGSTGHVSVYNYNSDNALIKETISNGPQTVTLPASLGNGEGEGLYTGSMQFSEKVKDIYVLATTAPRCQADAFGSVAYVGNDTFAGVKAHPFARDKYRMSFGSASPEEETKWLAMLHFPAETTPEEAANYTDLTRNYSLYDEEGNLDGEGNPIRWPNQGEMLRSFNQARTGVTWEAWEENRDINNEPEHGTWNIATPDLGNSPAYDKNYMGWHQFVLCASYFAPIVEPTEETVDYVQTNWYTICLPYNMTKAQLVKYLGIPASTNIVHNMLGDTEVDTDRLPDIRTMIGVTRTKEKGTTKNKITIHLSKNLAKENNDVNVGLRGAAYVSADENNYLKGGYPYFIKAYLPTSIKSQMESLSLGALTMMRITRSADAATILNQKGYTENSAKTLNEAVLAPKEIKVQAWYENGEDKYFAKKNDTEDSKEAEEADDFLYGFQGQYWEQMLPLGCYYLAANQKFYRATAEDTNNPGWSVWKWKPYVAVITPKTSKTETEVKKNGAQYTQSYSEVFSAEDDSFAGTTWARSTFELVFDDDIIEVGEDGNETTAIEQLENGAIQFTSGKVFNMAGQYVGDSLSGLPKGMYIVNGKKYVVK